MFVLVMTYFFFGQPQYTRTADFDDFETCNNVAVAMRADNRPNYVTMALCYPEKK